MDTNQTAFMKLWGQYDDLHKLALVNAVKGEGNREIDLLSVDDRNAYQAGGRVYDRTGYDAWFAFDGDVRADLAREGFVPTPHQSHRGEKPHGHGKHGG
jgi:hypothetical protein